MSETVSAGGSPADNLQFDQVEYTSPAPAATCRLCNQPMQDAYYDVNGQAVCPNCREQIEQALGSGWALGRFARAALFGSLAGAAGAAIYYGVRELTQMEFGLIAILVGLMIGGAVKKGSGSRGGWLYQCLAMFLTYTAIVATYIPPAIQAFREHAAKEEAAQAQQPAGAGQAQGGAKAAPPGGGAAGGGAAGAHAQVSLGEALLAIVILIGLAYALPVYIGFQSPMALVIIGIGLYEAWVMNRRAPLVIRGPYKISAASAGGAVHVEPAG